MSTSTDTAAANVAFGGGDVPGFLSHIADDVRWESDWEDKYTQHEGRYRDEQLHLWTYGADGKVVALQHFMDTAKILAATRGADTTAGR